MRLMLALALCGSVGCARDDGAAPARPIVAVSLPPLAYFVDQLVGDWVEVAIMIPPGANHHVWEPKIEQMRAASAAAVYVAVGHPHFPFETSWLDRLLEGNAEVRRVSCGARAEQLEGDPHLWASPRAVRGFVRDLADALRQAMPQQAAEITARETKLRAEVEALDGELTQLLAPVRGRRFYVFHPAWGYLAHDYGLEQVAIEHDGKEPGPGDVARVIRAAKADGVRAIFTQPQYSERSAGLVAQEIGAELVSIDPLSRDWPASLRHAARAIAAALAPTPGP